MRPVKTKKDFVKRYQANEFGNRSPTWLTLQDWLNDPSTKEDSSRLFHLRNKVAGGTTYYDVTPDEILNLAPKLDTAKFYVSAMAPTDQTLIQGEVWESPDGLCLRYTTVTKPMRDALGTWETTVYGLAAKLLLSAYLCPRSYEWLQYLLETYDNHVVEFSTYGRNFGTVKNMNTVFWEVRLY